MQRLSQVDWLGVVPTPDNFMIRILVDIAADRNAPAAITLDHFLTACMTHARPGRDVSVDEQLILFKGRSKHTMNITSKAAGKGFKIYSLCCGNYLLGLHFASRIIKRLITFSYTN